MIKLYFDPRMLDHRPRLGHPEQPERVATVLRHLERTGLKQECSIGITREATDEELLRVHTQGHLSAIAEQSAAGGGQIEADTWLSGESDRAGRVAAGTIIEAVESICRGNEKQAFCLVRPPGHHARPSNPMGFCLYGSVAVAAADAIQRLQVNRILIIDWDVHHGNGTQEMFYDSEQVGFFSIHRHPFYPGTGMNDETGTGLGLGATLNVPVRAIITRAEYLAAFQQGVETIARKIKPELILISAGFDAHAEDPVGNLGLEVEDFGEMTRFVQEVARNYSEARLVSILEGGYNQGILAGCVAEHLEMLKVQEK